MNTQGNSTYERIDHHVRKKLYSSNIQHQRLMQHMLGNDPVEAMIRYIASLQKIGVNLPPDLLVTEGKEIIVEHRWVEGETLKEVFQRSPKDYCRTIETIGTWQKTLQMSFADARLDTNLENFILTERGLILVDILPPLLSSRCYVPQDVYEDILLKLCFSDTISLTALIGYALKLFLSTAKLYPDRNFSTIIEQWDILAAPPVVRREPADLFAARVQIALAALKGKISRQEALAFYKITSLRSLTLLNSVHQMTKIAQSWDAYDVYLGDLKGVLS